MKNNLVPEPRQDVNGKIVVRHVRPDSHIKNQKLHVPKPSIEPKSVLQSVSLKEMDSGALTVTLLRDIRALERQNSVDYDTVFDALDAATFLHLDQKRGNRKNLAETPYIEHPLRNTVRAIRWGCRDQNVLVSTLLHDTVEDWAGKIVSHYLKRDDADTLSESEKRELAFGWVKDTFGSQVLHMVKAVSNPIHTGPKQTEKEKHLEYANHVRDSIKGDAHVFLVKFSDFVDNAVGLHHNNIEGKREGVSRRARKYRPVVDIFEQEFLNNEAIHDLVDEAGYAAIWEQIQEAKGRLDRLIKQSA